ncbi:MAG TPA: hypothetical protein VE377_21895 [Candidatus Dormibacteraeota bacterium]|nr:hypothetical protein [Candidatus Dormibacteraeota bacterium]
MKSPLYVSAVVALSLVSCNAFAGGGGPASGTPSRHAGAAVVSSPEDSTLPASSEFVIPGPQRSLLRMAGMSQEIAPQEVLPLLSQNVFTEGYQESTRPTEFLILLRRYVVQARELAALAENNGMVIRVSNCDDARPLLRILGYRTRTDCGNAGTSLQTEDPERAFLAIDSGFPLPELEQTLQGGKPFAYAYSSSPVPVLFAEGDWTTTSVKNHKEDSWDLIDTILNDPAVARLYWAMSRIDPDTRDYLQKSMGLRKLLPYAGVLDFYGRGLCISAGRVRVPGGVQAEPAWEDLVGASPASPAAFVSKLLAKDKGWLMAYFDVLSRANGTRQAYFTDRHRLRFFYRGLRTLDPTVPATKGSFRPAPSLLLLATRLHLDSNGEPLVPGNLDAWKDILLERRNSSVVRGSAKQVPGLKSPEELLQVMFALSRTAHEHGPLQMYMAMCDLDSRRSPEHRLSPATVRLLADKFEQFSDQYRIFSEFPALSDQSIALFLEVAQRLNSVPGAVRGDAFGTFQASVGIWQILARQGQIPNSQLNDSWQQIIKPFTSIRSAAQLFDAGRASLGELFRCSTGKAKGSQDEIIDLLAGPGQKTTEGEQVHREFSGRIRAVLDDQRLVSLDTLLLVGDALSEKARGKQPAEYVILLAGQTREFEMPRPIFTNSEHTEWAAGIYNNHHTDVQMRTELPKILKSRTASHAQIDEARGQLASFLRDTLVGLNYAYYEPPGAQALHNNPLFVRSHDFAGDTITGIETLWQAPELLGQGSPAGGGAHFVGSLADLPYALADLEQDFISPHSVQALIWKELTPELLTSAIVPRWWNVSPLELHAVALYQRAGEEILAASANDDALRSKVLAILSDRLLPRRSLQVEKVLRAGRVSELLPQMMPADTFYLAAEFRDRFPEQAGEWGIASRELQELCRQHPEDVGWKRLSHDFGAPHPQLAQNYGLELLNVTPMPPFSGYSSRFLAESWDSPNLYWARLADEGGYAPVMLNHFVPELTRMMIEKIFATDHEDWPALLRAMQETGTEFREGKLTPPSRIKAALP